MSPIRPAGEGAVYRQRVHYEGYDGEETIEIVGFEPNRRVSSEGRTGDILEHSEYHFTPENGSTKVEVSTELELAPEIAPIEPAIADIVVEQGQQDLDHLKDILEHRHAWRKA